VETRPARYRELLDLTLVAAFAAGRGAYRCCRVAAQLNRPGVKRGSRRILGVVRRILGVVRDDRSMGIRWGRTRYCEET